MSSMNTLRSMSPTRDLLNKFVKGLGTLVSKLQSRNFAPLRTHRLVLLGYTQGHPMDLFLKISVLQVNFCWLGDVEETICPWKESVAEKKNVSEGI